jgi:rare lipoprotein A
VRQRFLLVTLALLVAHGCVSSRPQPNGAARVVGQASWYGEEFAGRTTANGEIFDPMQLTAAHRTLPFGTIVDVRNQKTGKSVQVRINDRGPFIGNRIIDLSYAAAQQLGMVQAGIGEVELTVVRLGAGDREPPRAIVVRVDEPQTDAPRIPFPLPSEVKSAAPPRPEPVRTEPAPPAEPVVESVDVQVEKAGVPVRRQVSADGTTIVEVPVEGESAETPVRSAPPRTVVTTPRVSAPPPTPARFVLQLGAFQSVENANRLAERARAVTSRVYIDTVRELNRVRVGPFPTREAAIEAKEMLDAEAIASIVVPE